MTGKRASKGALAKRAVGRPSIYTPELATRILQCLRNGVTIKELGKRDDFPDQTTINEWIDRKPEFALSVSRARASGAWSLADAAQEIADTSRDNTDKDGRAIAETSAQVARDRLRVDTRLKLAAAWNAQEFGNRPNVNVNVNTQVAFALTPTQMAKLADATRPLVDVTPGAFTPVLAKAKAE